MNRLGDHFSRPCSRWSRLRQIVSWIGWLMVCLCLFVADAAWLAVLLIFSICVFRPRRMTEPTDKERLAIALAVLLVAPLLVVTFKWTAAIEFFRSPIGLLALLGLWLASVVKDFKFYRSLPPFHSRTISA